MKKKILISICIMAILFVVIMLFVTGGLKHTIAIGICLITENDTVLVIVDNNPMKVSNQSFNDELFIGLETGDKVIITHDGIDETYPFQTGVYKLLKIETDCIREVSIQTITKLAELGYTAK